MLIMIMIVITIAASSIEMAEVWVIFEYSPHPPGQSGLIRGSSTAVVTGLHYDSFWNFREIFLVSRHPLDCMNDRLEKELPANLVYLSSSASLLATADLVGDTVA